MQAILSEGVQGIVNVEVKGPRLNESKTERAGFVYGKDHRLHWRVTPPMPKLMVSIHVKIHVHCIYKIYYAYILQIEYDMCYRWIYGKIKVNFLTTIIINLRLFILVQRKGTCTCTYIHMMYVVSTFACTAAACV